MTPPAQYIARRLAAAVITLLVISFIVFVLVRMMPGDPARVLAGLAASQQDVDRLRMQLGLDLPWPEQYWLFLTHLAHGDLGLSSRNQLPVLGEILARLPATMALAVLSLTLAGVAGIASGIVAATHRNSKIDYLISAATLFGVSMPGYWLGLMLIVLFAVQLRWLPAAGSERPESYLLPSLTLATYSLALIARMTRSSMLEVLREDYIRTARAKGLGQQLVMARHAFRNAMIPVLTVMGLQFGTLLGGAVLTESVFGWPGMGRLLVDSIFARDYAMIQGTILVFALLFILVNLVVDLLYGVVDPRIHHG